MVSITGFLAQNVTGFTISILCQALQLLYAIMTTKFIFLREGFSRSEAVKLFVENILDYIPILAEDDVVIGVEFVYDYLQTK